MNPKSLFRTNPHLHREIESALPVSQRFDLAERRFRYGLEHSGNEDAPGGHDLRVLAAFSPPWVEEIPTEVPGFKVRARNALTRAGILSISQLVEISPDRMLDLPAFGRRTYEQTFEALSEYLMDHAAARLTQSTEDKEQVAALPAGDFSCFASIWQAILELVDEERTREVLTRRIGAPDGDPETLEAIGSDHDVCREQIRQLEADAIARLHENPRFHRIRSSIEAELERQIQWRGGAIPLGEDNPVAALRGASPLALKRFFQMVLKSQYRILIGPSAGGTQAARVVFGVSEDQLRQAIDDVKAFTIEHADRHRSTFMPLVLDHIRERFHESIHGDLKEYVDNWINWDHSIDPKIISFGDTVQATVAAILERSDRPMKIEEVQSIAKKEFGLDKPGRGHFNNVAGGLCVQPANQARNDVVVPIFLVGASTYCTNGHLPIEPAELSHLVSPLVELIRGGRQCLIPDEPYQWHTMDLWKELNKLVPDNELHEMKPEMGWRAVDWILRYHQPNGVVNLLKGRWVKDTPGVEQEARTLQEAIVYLLQNHFSGQRVPRKRMLEKLEQLQSRGARDQLQIKPPIRYEGGQYWLVRPTD